MKSLVGKIGTLALVAMAGLAVAACSSSIDTSSPSGSSAKHQENVGTVGLQLQPVSGITVTSVKYTVTQGNAPGAAVVQTGNLPTPGTGSNFTFGIPLPVGTGYYISLSGVAQENPAITCTSSFGPFDVLPNQSAPFNMTLTCVDSVKGTAVSTVDVKTDACPRLVVDYVVAEPGTADVGKSINVYSAAHDLDDAAKAIKFAWSIDAANAGVGSFTPANAANSVFACSGPGTNVPVTVTADNGQCKKALQTTISCKSLTCGNGVVEPNLGETCDFGAGPNHPADSTCPSNCVKICGNGILEGDEKCDPVPSDPATCLPPGDANQCQVRTPTCGDGFTTFPEKCDTKGNIGPDQKPLANGGVCASDCGSVALPTCGDGVVGGSEQCDAGTGTTANPVPAGSPTCGSDCKQIATPECVTCENAGDCFASVNNCENAAFTAAQKLNCYQVTECIETSKCLAGTGSLGKCYCGTLSTAACGAAPFDLTAAGAPNGACAALMQAGQPGVTTNSAKLGALTHKSRPAGAAGQRLNCDKTDANCAPICGGGLN